MDCFRLRQGFGGQVAALAMTWLPPEYDFAISRRTAPGVVKESRPSIERAQGMPGARCTRGPVCKMVENALTSIQVQTGATRHSLRNGFTAYIVISPENGSFASVAP